MQARHTTVPLFSQGHHREVRDRDGESPPTTRHRVSDQSRDFRQRGGLCSPLWCGPGCAANGDGASVCCRSSRYTIANQPSHADVYAGQHANSGPYADHRGDRATDRDQRAGHSDNRRHRDARAWPRHAADRDGGGADGRGRCTGSACADARATAATRATHADAYAGTPTATAAHSNTDPAPTARRERAATGLGRPPGPHCDSERGD